MHRETHKLTSGLKRSSLGEALISTSSLATPGLAWLMTSLDTVCRAVFKSLPPPVKLGTVIKRFTFINKYGSQTLYKLRTVSCCQFVASQAFNDRLNNRPNFQSIHQPPRTSSQPTDLPVYRPTNQTTNQPKNHPTDQASKQATIKSYPVSHSCNHENWGEQIWMCENKRQRGEAGLLRSGGFLQGQQSPPVASMRALWCLGPASG